MADLNDSSEFKINLLSMSQKQSPASGDIKAQIDHYFKKRGSAEKVLDYHDSSSKRLQGKNTQPHSDMIYKLAEKQSQSEADACKYGYISLGQGYHLFKKEEELNKSLIKINSKYKRKNIDPMEIGLKRDIEYERRVEMRKKNIRAETPWIKRLQKSSKTKGFVNFDQQINRTDFVEHSNKVYPRAHDERFVYREIPQISTKFRRSGKAVVDYSKQLPRISNFSLTRSTIKHNLSRKSPKQKKKGRNSTINFSSTGLCCDNIDQLQKSCSRLKLLNVIDNKAKISLERDSPERARLNKKLSNIFIGPKDRFSTVIPEKSRGYIHDYQKETDRFPPGVNTLNRNRESKWEVTSLAKAESLDRATRGQKNKNFKISKDAFFQKNERSSLPRYLLCDGNRNELDLVSNEKSLNINNTSNAKIYINPIGRPNNKERRQRAIEKTDVSALLFKEGYIKNFKDVKSPVKEYKKKGKNVFEKMLTMMI
ncbi:unnamed protein product [Moneuplotes crassus]|uniref:Uncharacterized protein n=1 Tax=Euplotes crassus TaxID=5936 RepID=A0AAD1XBV8_EUPCR|nr:unnamed protein product [Moneuplotes crassus]